MQHRPGSTVLRKSRPLAAIGCVTALLIASCATTSTGSASSAPPSSSTSAGSSSMSAAGSSATGMPSSAAGSAATESSAPGSSAPGSSAPGSSATATSAPSSSSPASSGAVTVDAAAAALLPATIRSSGVLKDGINVPNPPMEYLAGSDVTGFDADLARALAGKLGLQVSFTSLQFAALLTSLDAGRVDIVFSGLFDTVKRQAKYDIIDYFNTGAAIFTTTANATKFPDLPSLCGQTVETAVGTAFAAQLATLSTKICSGKPPIVVVELGGSLAEEVLEVTTGRAAAAITTPENLAYAMSTTPGAYVAVGAPFNPIPYGIQVTKANTGLRNALVAAFKDVMADGTYRTLLKKYKLESGARTSVTVNAGT